MKLPRFHVSKRGLLTKVHHMGLYSLFAISLLIGGTFALWQLGKYYSPTVNNTGGGTTVILRFSDHASDCSSHTPLFNQLISADSPCYTDDINSGPTLLVPLANGNNPMFRLQGEVEYQ